MSEQELNRYSKKIYFLVLKVFYWYFFYFSFLWICRVSNQFSWSVIKSSLIIYYNSDIVIYSLRLNCFDCLEFKLWQRSLANWTKESKDKGRNNIEVTVSQPNKPFNTVTSFYSSISSIKPQNIVIHS